jgi:type I site-specific restriction-modification system R (restriction) subunit
MRAADRRGEQLGLTVEEVAFYDALEVNDSAVKILGDETLRAIAQELARAVRNNVTIDMDAARERARQDASDGQAHPTPLWRSAGQTGEGDTDRAGAG